MLFLRTVACHHLSDLSHNYPIVPCVCPLSIPPPLIALPHPNICPYVAPPSIYLLHLIYLHSLYQGITANLQIAYLLLSKDIIGTARMLHSYPSHYRP